MKYILAALIMSFGILFVAVVLLISLSVQVTGNVVEYLGLAWLLLAIAAYPIAKKLIRDE